MHNRAYNGQPIGGMWGEMAVIDAQHEGAEWVAPIS
jgi:hypothetical protein